MEVKEELEDEPNTATRFEECFVSGVPEDYQTESLDQEPTKESLTCDSTSFSDLNNENEGSNHFYFKSEPSAISKWSEEAPSVSYCKSFPKLAKALRESEAVVAGVSDDNSDHHEGLVAAQSNEDYRSEDCTESNESNSLFMAPSLTDACPEDYYLICGDNDPVVLSKPQATNSVLAADTEETLISPSEKIPKKISKRKQQPKPDDDEFWVVDSEEQISALVTPSSSTQIPLESTKSKRRCEKSVVMRDLDRRVYQTSTEFDYGESTLVDSENESGVIVDTSIIMTDNHELWVVENEGQIRALNLPLSEIQSPSKRLKSNKKGKKSVQMPYLSEEVNESSTEFNEGGATMTSAKSESSEGECEQILTQPALPENTWIMCISSPEVSELGDQEVNDCDLPTAENVVNDSYNETTEIESEMIAIVDDGCLFIEEPQKIDGEEQGIGYKLDEENEWPEVKLEETIDMPAISREDMFDEQEALQELVAMNNGSDSEDEVVLVNWEEVIELPSNPRKPLIMCRPSHRGNEEGGLVNQSLSINNVEGIDKSDCSQTTEPTKPRRRKQSIVYKSDSVDEPDVTIIDSDDDIEMIVVARKGETETDTDEDEDDETDIMFDNSELTCNICRKTFDSSLLLRVHKRTHHSAKSYQCVECEVTLFSEFGLECHLCDHDDISFVCKRCECVFPSEWSVVSHECVCGEHVQTQTRAACKICGLNVTRRLLNRHIAEYHADVLAKWNVIDLEKECGNLQSAEELSE